MRTFTLTRQRQGGKPDDISKFLVDRTGLRRHRVNRIISIIVVPVGVISILFVVIVSRDRNRVIIAVVYSVFPRYTTWTIRQENDSAGWTSNKLGSSDDSGGIGSEEKASL